MAVFTPKIKLWNSSGTLLLPRSYPPGCSPLNPGSPAPPLLQPTPGCLPPPSHTSLVSLDVPPSVRLSESHSQQPPGPAHAPRDGNLNHLPPLVHPPNFLQLFCPRMNLPSVEVTLPLIPPPYLTLPLPQLQSLSHEPRPRKLAGAPAPLRTAPAPWGADSESYQNHLWVSLR